MIDTREGIKRAAERTAGAPVRFLEAVPVVETFRGDVLWEGAVSEFEAKGGNVFAWAVEGDSEPQFVAVMRKPPIDSPLAAVRAWLVSEARS